MVRRSHAVVDVAALVTASNTTEREIGETEAATRAAVVTLGELTGMGTALAETAYVLARHLDAGAGMAAAAVARELRATLAALSSTVEPEAADADTGPE